MIKKIKNINFKKIICFFIGHKYIPMLFENDNCIINKGCTRCKKPSDKKEDKSYKLFYCELKNGTILFDYQKTEQYQTELKNKIQKDIKKYERIYKLNNILK